MRNTNRTATLTALAMLALAVAPSLSHAGPVVVGSGWNEFNWTTPAVYGVPPSVDQNETPFTFTTATAVRLDVTDAFANGDRFQVNNNGVSLGNTYLTSQVNGTAPYTTDPNTAFSDVNFSHGTWILGPGTYSLTFTAVQPVAGVAAGANNKAYFRLEPSVTPAETPEPGTMCMLAIGGVAFAFRRVRRGLGLAGKEPAPAV